MDKPCTQILFGVGHADVSRFLRVRKDMVAAFCTTQHPAVVLQLLDQQPAIHGGDYIHQISAARLAPTPAAVHRQAGNRGLRLSGTAEKARALIFLPA